jgi:hypothetical protein
MSPLSRPIHIAAERTLEDARAHLLSLGGLLVHRRLPGPAWVLHTFPPLLRFLKEHGLVRSERVAAAQLLVELHDAVCGGAEVAPLLAALHAFALLCTAAIQAAFRDRAAELRLVEGLRLARLARG